MEQPSGRFLSSRRIIQILFGHQGKIERAPPYAGVSHVPPNNKPGPSDTRKIGFR
jgi:hypothetical protein